MIDRDYLEELLTGTSQSELIVQIMSLSDEKLAYMYPETILAECNNCCSSYLEQELDRDGNCQDCAEWLDSHNTCDICGEEFELPDLDEDDLCTDCRETNEDEDGDGD